MESGFSEWVKFVFARFTQNALKHVSFVKKDQCCLVRLLSTQWAGGNLRALKVLV